MLDDVEPDRLLALLAWWREAGVDAVVDADPVDWSGREAGPGAGFAWPPASATADAALATQAGAGRSQDMPARTRQPVPAARPPEQPGSPAARPAATPVAAPGAPAVPQARPPPASAPAGVATMAAREAARRAGSLDELGRHLAAFDGCPLKATAKNTCFYRGAPAARLMIVGEAPGRDEDIEGRPFVGKAGQLLDRMLAAIGLAEKDVHITNVVYWRPPGNRVPTSEEVEICRPFVERQIALVAPDVLMTLGGVAAKGMLGVADGILRVRGKWRQLAVEGRSIPVMPTLHPAYLLRTPAAKRQAWRDLVQVRLALDGGSDRGRKQ